MRQARGGVWMLVAGMALGGTAHGQEPPLTLERALSLAREHSPALVRAAADERGAEGASAAARSGRRPTIDVDVLHLRFRDPPSLALGTAGRFAPIPTSGTLMHLGLLQPLYTGGRVGGAVAAADWGTRAAAATYEAVEVELTAEVARAHDNALLAEAMLDVAEEAVRVLEAALTLAEDHHAAGTVARLDVLRAETRLAEAKQKMRAAAEVVIATRDGLLVSIGLDHAARPGVVGLLAPARITLDPTTVEELLSRAREDRPELRALAAGAEASRQKAQVARAQRTPTAGLYLGGLATRPELVTGDRGWSTDLVAGLVVTWSLFDFGRSEAQAEIALAEAEALGADARGSAELATARVHQQMRNLARAELDIAAGRENVQRAERALAIAQDRYADGVGIQLEVFEAEADLSRVRGALLVAIHDHRVAAIELHRTAGLAVDPTLLTPGGQQ